MRRDLAACARIVAGSDLGTPIRLKHRHRSMLHLMLGLRAPTCAPPSTSTTICSPKPLS
jgi:hypothetical protein